MSVFWKKKTALHLGMVGYNSNDFRYEGKVPGVFSKCDFDIDICYNRYVVDAKSFLGVYGLDFTKPLSVSYDGYNDKFEELLRQYAIAC